MLNHALLLWDRYVEDNRRAVVQAPFLHCFAQPRHNFNKGHANSHVAEQAQAIYAELWLIHPWRCVFSWACSNSSCHPTAEPTASLGAYVDTSCRAPMHGVEVRLVQDGCAEQLRAMASLSALVAGFVMVAFVQFNFDPGGGCLCLCYWALASPMPSLCALLRLGAAKSVACCGRKHDKERERDKQAAEWAYVLAGRTECLLHVYVHLDTGQHFQDLYSSDIFGRASSLHFAVLLLCPQVDQPSILHSASAKPCDHPHTYGRPVTWPGYGHNSSCS